jgi:uncharacterized integral membrane protein
MSGDLRPARGETTDLGTTDLGTTDLGTTDLGATDLGETAPAEPTTDQPISPTAGQPHTRTGAAWFGICAAALVTVVLIVFMLQNTSSVQVNFLWMHGNVPLALALLIAAVGSAIVTMVVGVARITQLRRLSRRQRLADGRTTP